MTFALLPPRLPAALMRRAAPTPAPQPRLLALNAALAAQLGLDAAALSAPAGVAILVGNAPVGGSEPVALVYAGHQFGSFVPQLGDGRAILLGEAASRDQGRFDVQLKGAGPTTFSRGGDGRAALGPVLREYVLSEAMAALGIPTTRSLAAVATGSPVFRNQVLPGAVLTRVAASHLRIGTFQYFAARGDRKTVAELTEFALQRHFATADRAAGDALALFDQVVSAQARLVAQWMGVGFVHGVMNTDNTAISGETLDYGPCAFLDGFDPQRTFSSIDHGGRYAYANQPQIALWNLARFAECLLPLVDPDEDRAVEQLVERLATFTPRFDAAYEAIFARKLGLGEAQAGDRALIDSLLGVIAAERVDFTSFFRALADQVASPTPTALDPWFNDPGPLHAWWPRWLARLQIDGGDSQQQRARCRAANPAFIARNHQVEAMIAAAVAGDLAPFDRLNRVLARPFDDQEDALDLAVAPRNEQWAYRTFCGT